MNRDNRPDGPILFWLAAIGFFFAGLFAGRLLFGGVIQVAASPDGQWRVELADYDSSTRYELYATPSVGGVRRRISKTPIHDFDVSSFAITPDSSRVVYRFGRTATGAWGLYSTPISSSSATALSAALAYVEDGFRAGVSDVHFQGSAMAGASLSWLAVPVVGGVPKPLAIFADGFEGGSTGAWR